MMNKKEIWIIGTEPPCPRCDYLTRMVQDLVNEKGLFVPVRHLAYTGKEAVDFAAEQGMVPGTAKDVAAKLGIAMDWDKVNQLIQSSPKAQSNSVSPQCCPTTAAQWSPALDAVLKPCENRALEADIMMTPVLVLDGRCYHQGSVPSKKNVDRWIDSVYRQTEKGGAANHVIEVLGTGCNSCNMLHKHVVTALEALYTGSDARVVKRTDIDYFLSKNVTTTPGLIVDGKLLSQGKVLSVAQLKDLLKTQFRM